MRGKSADGLLIVCEPRASSAFDKKNISVYRKAQVWLMAKKGQEMRREMQQTRAIKSSKHHFALAGEAIHTIQACAPVVAGRRKALVDVL